jgi:hypothetical protein
MADNCKICNKIISHTQYNCFCGMCSRCYDNPYRDLNNKEQEEWLKLGSSCSDRGDGAD